MGINQFANHHLQMILHKVRFQPFRSFLLKNELFVSDIYDFSKCLKRLFHTLNIFPPFLILSSCPQIWKRFCRYAGSTMNILCVCSQILTRSKWNWCREQKCLFQNDIRNKTNTKLYKKLINLSQVKMVASASGQDVYPHRGVLIRYSAQAIIIPIIVIINNNNNFMIFIIKLQ